MKIDGIALLQMIRDEKIKENTLIEVSGGIHAHLPYVIFGENKRLYWAYCKTNLQGVAMSDELIEYEFEIIEDKPEKIDEEQYFYNYAEYDKNQHELDKVLYIIRALNKLEKKCSDNAKALNYLLEKSDK